MAVPSYTTDLTVINACDSNTTPTAWTNIGTGADATETDYYIHNGACISKPFNITAGGLYTDYGSNITFASGECYWLWVYFGAPNALLAEASGGMRALVGSSAGNYEMWNVMGSDTNPYGGWRCVPVDIVNVTRDAVTGTPAGTFRIFGSFANTSVTIGKGNPLGIDVIRIGRGEARIADGSEADGFATFAGLATANDNPTTGRWGLCQAGDGIYLVQGLLIFGYGSATDFRDQNKSIVINNTKKVTSGFNRIEVRNALSRVDWTNINFTALGTVARGNFECIDNADVNLDTCVFTDMDTFAFLSNTSALNCTFRRCNAVTATGSDLRGSGFRTPTVVADASGLVWTDTTETDGLLDNATFSKGTNAHHAISFASTTTDIDYTLRGIDFTGFNAADSQNDSAIYVAATSGTITIYLVGCSGAIKYKSAGASVTFISDPVTVSVNVKDSAEVPANIQDARVFIKASDNTGPFPFEEAVTIVNSGTTATVTHTDGSHAMAIGDKVVISGASLEANNGIFTIITVPTTATYTYTMGSAPGDGAVPGTIISTFVVIGAANGTGGLTDVNGNISMSRVFPANQNIVGWARKASDPGPYYKTGPIGGSVNSTTGFSANVQLILDE